MIAAFQALPFCPWPLRPARDPYSPMPIARQPVLRRPDEGRTLGVVGDVYRFLATGEETNGKYALFEALVPPGGGPPPHIHSREEASFYILEGELTLYIGEQRIAAREGTFANVPVGTLHRFRNESDKPVRLLITVTPAGLENMFFEIAQPVEPGATSAAPPTEELLARLPAIAAKYGVEIKVPPH
jgi:quercetin dioxygenase-like cupin family protein